MPIGGVWHIQNNIMNVLAKSVTEYEQNKTITLDKNKIIRLSLKNENHKSLPLLTEYEITLVKHSTK